MSLLDSNKIIQAAESKIEEGLEPDIKAAYDKVVTAGMKVALKDGPNGILASLKNSKDPVSDCAIGAVKLVLMLRKNARGTMPVRAMVSGGTVLMLKALDFAERAGLVKISNDDVVRASKMFADALFHALKITPQMIRTAATKVHGLTQDPTAMEQMKRASGVVKDPNASEPMPMPNADEAVQ